MPEAGPAEPRVIPPQQDLPVAWASPEEQEHLVVFFSRPMLRA